MKKYILIIVFALVGITSCEENFLNQTPDSLIVPENMDDPELLLNGAYEQMRSSNSSWKIWTNVLTNTGNDEVLRNVLKTLNTTWVNLTTFNYGTQEDAINNVWGVLYGGVNAANHAIFAARNVDNIEVEAEARFVRGFYYFTLATLHGGVPIMKSFNDDPLTQRSSVEDVLLFVEEDWKFAFENGPATPVRAGRTSRLTAAGFLAKLYLYIGGCMQNNVDSAIAAVSTDPEAVKLVSFSNWSDTRTPAQYFSLAEQYANEVYGNYSLIPNYRDNFRKSGEDEARANEWLFNLEASSILGEGGNPEAFNMGNGFHMQNSQHNVPNYEFIDMYIDADTRKGNLAKLARPNDAKEEIDGYIHFLDNTPNRNGGVNNYIYGKWRADIAAGLHRRWMSSSLALLRYADVLLMLSEAKFLNGDELGARNLLSEVRARATSTGAETDQAVLDEMTATYYNADFMQELMDERKRELCAEGHRRKDLIHTGMLFTAINGLTDQTTNGDNWKQGGETVRAMKANLAAHPYRIWLPIPGQQISVARYKQNPGYPTEEN